MINAYGEAMNGGKQANQSATQEQGRTQAAPVQRPQGNKVSGDALLNMMGQRTIKGM